MSVGGNAITASAASTRFGRAVAAAARRFAFSDWAPQTAAIFGVLAILITTSTALIQHRLDALEQISQRHAIERGVLPPALVSQSFTLAPDEIRNLEPDAARAFNDGLPFSTLPILAARPFIMTPDKIDEYARALDCLTAAIYYEAASETTEGQAAVAQVVLNRMRHPAYPNTVCGVVFQGSERTTGCQFSFTCDGAMARIPSVEGWGRAKAVAGAALNGSVAAGVGMATHYHTDWVAPYWAERLVKMRQIGTHIFYRWTGSWGLPFAFSRIHTGSEPIIAKMAALSTPIENLDDMTMVEMAEASAPLIIVQPLTAPPLEPIVVASAAPDAEAVPAPTPPPPAPAPVLANPLATPADARPPRRSRIAVPSGW